MTVVGLDGRRDRPDPVGHPGRLRRPDRDRVRLDLADHDRQPARPARVGQHLRRPDLPVRRAWPWRSWPSASSTSSAGRSCRSPPQPDAVPFPDPHRADRDPAAAQGVRRRLGRADRRRGHRQRRAGVQAARVEERRQHDDRDGRPAGHPVRRPHPRSPSQYGLRPTEAGRPVDRRARRRRRPSATARVLFVTFAASTALILFLAANTSFNAFPRLAAILAEDGYMPRQFSFRGDRLAYSWGIVLLAAIAFGAAVGVRRRHPRPDPALLGRRVRVLHPQPDRHGPPLARRRASRAGAGGWRSTRSAAS